MAIDSEAEKSITKESVPPRGERNASQVAVPTSEATTANAGNPGGYALPNNDVHPEPVELDEVDRRKLRLSDVPNTEIQITINEANAVPVGEGTIMSTTEAVILGSGVEMEHARASTSTKEEKPAETPLAKKGFITLIHYNGKEYILPWALCQTWKGMEDLIKISYRGNENVRKEIDRGKYELYTDDSAIIIPDYWDMLVKPGWRIVIQLKSQKSPTVDSSDYSDSSSASDDDSGQDQDKSDKKELKTETVYAPKVNYTVMYYERKWGDDIFLYSTTYDDPVSLDRWDGEARELPVLEEKRAVTLAQGHGRRQKDFTSKARPKLDDGDNVGRKSLHIRSPLLLNVLRSIIKYSSKEPSGDITDELKGGEFEHPYADLFYYKEELSNYKKDTTGPRANHTPEYNAQCDLHIDLLLEYLDQESSIQLKSLEANWAKKVPTTTFAGFWLLLKPGTDVYIEEEGQFNAYVVDSVSGGIDYQPQKRWLISARSYSVRVWNLIYDGQVIRRISRLIHVAVFDNERDIMSLPLIPTRFQDKIDGGARRRQLIERGKKVYQFAKGPTFLEYTGMGLKPGWKKYNRARVVVEHESHPWERTEFDSLYIWHLGGEPTNIGERARAPRCECSKCANVGTEKYVLSTFSDYDDIDPKKISELSEHQYMLCMSHMFGFILKDRAYDLLDVGHLMEPKMAENAIDRLVMRPEENKNAIKAIVKTYAESNDAELFSADYIHGKGEGHIFLLHGPPGTGKTFTAESVAEYTKRPLLSITAADLGHEPIVLEKNLLRFFKDASNWDAIVLLDEADVYLERRSVNDLRRNSIVSIFLRAMEYFQGILFLTTNRVGHFDEAFMSRIHVSIGYERLDEKARGQIWEDLFRKLKEDHKNGGPEIRYEYEAKEYVKKNQDVKNLHWNGREIRNAFQTAVALAMFDNNAAKEKSPSSEDLIPEVKEKHLSQVVSMSAAFKEYIIATHEGIEDADLAYKQGIRYDKLKNRTGNTIVNS